MQRCLIGGDQELCLAAHRYGRSPLTRLLFAIPLDFYAIASEAPWLPSRSGDGSMRVHTTRARREP
jgi:hypothetical protein